MWNSHLARRNTRLTVCATLLLGLIVSAFIILPPTSRARLEIQHTPLGPDQKRSKPEYVPGQVLVRYRSDVTAKRQQRAMTALSVEGRAIPIQVERFEGSDLVAGLRLAHVAPEDTGSAIAALKEQPDVLYAEPNYIMHADLTPNDPQFGSLYGLTKIGAPTAWNTTTGSASVVVGNVDEGIDVSHPDLQANIWVNPAPGSISGISGDVNGYDFVNNSGTIPPGDHATHTAGTIGAVGNNGVGVVGVNWTVKLMSLRFLGAGGGSDSDAIRAYNYAKQMRDLWVSSGGVKGANVRVLNNSYGGGGFSQASLDAIRALDQSGILFVASDGNDGIDSDVTPHFPSGYDSPNVISLVATDSSDALAGFSNFGTQTATLGAPGVFIQSTTTNNTYSSFSGTSMASPHASGAAALLLAQNPNLTVQQLKALLIFNGDLVASLNGKTLSGRRLNVANSLQALAENDTTPPGTVTNFSVTSQSGRTLNLGWTASGDDGASGNASLYQLSFVDAITGAVVPLKSLVPPASGTPQTLSVKVPFGHSKGTVKLREFDNVGNEGTPATVNASVSFVDGDPYAKTLGPNAPLSTGGTHLNLQFDDRYRQGYPLPFSFPFFGTNNSTVTISTNGNLYFSPPPLRSNGDADEVPSSVSQLTSFKMIAGLWDDLYLGTDQRADADVYVVQPDANTIIFRWQGVPCNDQGTGCTFGGPVNFEIELRSNGLIQTRYGSGNTNLFPVVGISGGEPDPYVFTSHTSEITSKSLTNAQTVTYIPRGVINPVDNNNFLVSQHYRDFLSREPDVDGLGYWSDQLAQCGTDPACLAPRRVDVSNAFVFEDEFQLTGAYVYRLYRAAFGNDQPFPNSFPDPANPGEEKKLMSYAVWANDRALVVGGATLAQSQLDLANAFVARPAFASRYPQVDGPSFVDAVILRIKNDITLNSVPVDLSSQRNTLISNFNLGGRGLVMWHVANDYWNGCDRQPGNPAAPCVTTGFGAAVDNRTFIDAEYNRAFVFSEYGGYLRRELDTAGFLFWLSKVNSKPLRNVPKQHSMVCAFLNSAEYQLRFSPLVTRNDQVCQSLYP